MFIAAAVLSVLLALVLLMSARAKLTKDETVTTSLTGLGVPLSWFPPLAAAEIAGALGLIAGLWLGPLGIAAAIGVVLYFIGAVATHLRARDFKGFTTPLVILIVAAVTLALRAATL